MKLEIRKKALLKILAAVVVIGCNYDGGGDGGHSSFRRASGGNGHSST